MRTRESTTIPGPALALSSRDRTEPNCIICLVTSRRKQGILWKTRKGSDSTTPAQVESLLNKAILLDPKLGGAYLLLGILYSDRGDFPKAIAAYQQASKADSQMDESHYRVAQIYRRRGEKAKA